MPVRDRLIIGGCLVALIALAWAYLVVLDRHHAAESALAGAAASIAVPWGPADVAFTFAMWLVMMIGMMLPSAVPMLSLFAATQARQGPRRVPSAVLCFALGYVAVWAGFSAVATIAQWALHEAALLSPEMALASARAGGAIVIAAGIYQLTPLKRACLRGCQSPLGFVVTRWRPGAGGALRMGVDHGVFCTGCCWALMCVLFVVGVMNLAWVAALTLFVLVEKLGRSGTVVSTAAGIAMIAAGLVMIVR